MKKTTVFIVIITMIIIGTVAVASTQYNIVSSIQIISSGIKPACDNRDERGIIWFTQDDKGDYIEVCKYIPDGNTSINTTKLPEQVAGQSCVRSSANKKIYCLGGTNKANKISDQIIEFDVGLNKVIIKTEKLPEPLTQLSCSENSLTNKIYCFGGYNINYSTKIIEYDPVSGIVLLKNANLPIGIDSTSCTEKRSTHKIYCFGGHNINGYSNKIYEYTSTTDTILTKNSILPHQKSELSCKENFLSGLIYCFGGSTPEEGAIRQILEYNPIFDSIQTKSTELPISLRGISCIEERSDHTIYCYGGTNNFSQSDSIIQYDPRTNRIRTLEIKLPEATAFSDCVKDLNTKNTYCIGGISNQGFSNRIITHNLNDLGWKKIG